MDRIIKKKDLENGDKVRQTVDMNETVRFFEDIGLPVSETTKSQIAELNNGRCKND